MKSTTLKSVLIAGIMIIFSGQQVFAEKTSEEIAKELANPIGSLISVPFQFTYDDNIGLGDDGERWTLNFQPVIPFEINQDWNVISRTIIPIIHQNDIPADGDNDAGLGDIVQSFFFSPKAPTSSGWILGAGPVTLIPTGTKDRLSGKKWGFGPTGIGLKQNGPWTYGGLANHIWSVAGDDDRADVSSTLLQPFVTYTTPSAVSYSLVADATYDWEEEQWSIPVAIGVKKVVNIGGQLMSIGGNVRYHAESPDTGAEGFGGRLIVTFLFPK